MINQLRELKYKLSSKWTSFTYIFRKPYYRYRLFKRFCKTPYYGAWEMVNPIFDYPFEILCEFYETYIDKITYRWNIDECEDYEKECLIRQNNDNEEVEWLYNWYTVERLQRQEEIDYLLHIWSEHSVHWFSPYDEYSVRWNNASSKYGEYLFKMLRQEEEKFAQEQEDAFIRLIKIRNRLWD